MKQHQTSNTPTRLRSLLRHASLSLLTALALLGVASKTNAQATYSLSNTWSAAVLTTSRSMAYGALSNQVFIASTAPSITVLNGADGSAVGTMSVSWLTAGSGTFKLDQIGVADDGVIYGCTLQVSTSSANLFKIFRWGSWNDTAQVVAYSADPTTGTALEGKRIGDTMVVTGSGTNTVILAGLNGVNSFVLFSTTDGINFTPKVLTVASDLPTPGGSVQTGLAFYTNNTFMVKPTTSGNTNIYLVQYPTNFASLTSPVAGTVLTTANTATGNIQPISYAPLGNLLAGMTVVSQNATVVNLYSLPDFTTGSSLSASASFTSPTSNGNGTGGVAMGGQGKTNFVYAMTTGNSITAFKITTIPPQPPTIATAPVGTAGAYPPFTLSVTASLTSAKPLSYQWQATNTAVVGSFTNISGATTNTYAVTTVTTNYYRVIITNSIGSITSAPVEVTTLRAVTNSSVSNLWTVAVGQSGYPWLTTDDRGRGIAYDTNSQRVVVTGNTTSLFILDANTGANLGNLSLSNVSFGGNLISGFVDQVGIADDGAVYAGNLVSSGGTFNLYRWSSPATNVIATLAFTGDVANGAGTGDRWGDTMAVRGSGTGTQILLGSQNGTNAALLTTTDGTNFTSSLIAISGVPAAFAVNGVAFDAGNAFWAKKNGGDLYKISFDPVALTGSVVFDYAQPSQIGTTVTGVGIDSAHNIFAGIVSTPTDSPNDLRLYQLTGTSDAPVLFEQAFFASANANGNGNAVIAMKYPRAYGLSVNNGIVAVTYGTPASTPAIINTPPASQAVYTNLSTVVSMTVSASGSLPLYYQWRFNSNNITGATNSVYSITNPPLSAGGYYDVVVHNIGATVTSTPPALLTLLIPVTSSVVTQLWTLAPGSVSFLDASSYNTRGLAYDTNTGYLVVADHVNLYVLNGADGTSAGFNMNVLGLPTGLNGWTFGQIGVADDGVLYGCDLSGDGKGFTITSWSSVSSGASLNTAYAQSDQLSTLSPNDRWGDTMAVRGAGANTQILLGSYAGTNVVLFTTTDGQTFTPTLISITNSGVSAGFSGLGIAFGAGNTFYAKGGRGFNLRQVAFDLVAGIGTVLQTYAAGTQTPNDFTGLGVDVTNNILAGVCFDDAPNDLQLYQLTGNTNPPVLFDQAFFPANNANSQFNAQVAIKFPYAFGLDVNNGLVALTYGVPPALLTTFNVTATNISGTGLVLTWPSVVGRSYQVQSATALTPPASTWSNIGSAIAGTGANLSYTNSTLNGSGLFYRVSGH